MSCVCWKESKAFFSSLLYYPVRMRKGYKVIGLSVCLSSSVYAKTYNLMEKRKWCVPTYDRTHTCMYYNSSCNNILYVHITIRVPHPTQDRMDFSHFSKALFLKRLERFCSTLLLHTATMVQTLMMPRISFWNECYRFALNSKFHSATKDWEMNKRVDTKNKTKYSSWVLSSWQFNSFISWSFVAEWDFEFGANL